MHSVEPEVFILAESAVDRRGIDDYLKAIGAEEWDTDAVTDTEEIIEVASRSCYMSFGLGLNDNLTRVREGNQAHLSNILKSGHGSVLEHGWVTFAFHNVSRVFTHELVRHRAGVAISQESLRYVRADDLGAWMPPAFKGNKVAEMVMNAAFLNSESSYANLLGLAAEQEGKERSLEGFNSLSMSIKKRYTSAARRVLPIGMATNIVWSCNMRALRHVIEMRTEPSAEEEIRLVLSKVASLAIARWRNIFGDYRVTEKDGYPSQYHFESSKV